MTSNILIVALCCVGVIFATKLCVKLSKLALLGLAVYLALNFLEVL